MRNDNSTSGIAEDLIRSFVQIGCAETHTKTLIEKRVSELENGMVEETDMDKQIQVIENLKSDLEQQAQSRREIMLLLFNMFDGKGNKEKWCLVKHLGIAMYTLFESYQASDMDNELMQLALDVNKQFIKATSDFLGVEITECASCFSDILKAGV